MRYEIVWLPQAEIRFEEITDYLRNKWSQKEVDNFIARVNEVIDIISETPDLYKYSIKQKIYEAVVTSHNILLYRIKGNKVELMTFFDTRQDPNKKYTEE